MKLKSIELLGFKSFAKKSKLDFNAPVVGIVGPNGSGKSNVVEAFRFVLGEQSMKSLRGKSGKDLIFKGGSALPKSSRAGVEIVFDNSDRVFKLSGREEPINLDYEEIILKREVYPDGGGGYYINNTQVRLKDIIELLASVNIGASGHHIVSQGEADRILTASPRDRRSMIEDALGLKVYQYKLKDAGKKLQKTAENMREVESLRRELAPHIKYLKKQVEKVERGVELRRELSGLYMDYFRNEESFLREEENVLKTKSHETEKEIKEVEVKLKAFAYTDADTSEKSKLAEIDKFQNEISVLGRTKDELSRKLGRIEGVIEFQGKDALGEPNVSIKTAEFENFISDMDKTLGEALGTSDLNTVRENIRTLKNILSDFNNKFSKKREGAPINFKDLENSKKDLAFQLSEIEKVKSGLETKVTSLRKSMEDARADAFRDQEARFILEGKKQKLVSEQEILKARFETFRVRKSGFEEETKEAVSLVGSQILDYKNASIRNSPTEVDKKAIERIKIKLEDIGTGSGDDVMKEFGEVSERDEFLARELSDLESGVANLKKLIDDLKETLEKEFKTGLGEINSRFEEFFKLMFGGGSAGLSSVNPVIRKTKSEDGNEMDELESIGEEEELEQGIDIEVTLPQKKVKDLQMLSGGERSLTSIALVFAITQVNPPPFLVLDETDAALDEANSRRYGDMIEKLSKYSQLITVTHNRETMSRADVIYGVTVGSDGSSKLLSIKFAEAENYAK